ncbi:MAG TPA: magnesium transporter CorA family protein [Stellaceae bacterium]|jgi:magnesium transporter|nr:magnesium transporter CorA family protein [Stellaceae bacterium]
MLTLYHSRSKSGERQADLAGASLPENVAWIDLLRPDADEVAFVTRTTGLHVPSIEDLSEIESSSRLRNQNGAIYLSAPLVYRADSNQPLTTPVGFVLTRERLVTVRFEELTSFNMFANRDLADETDPLTSAAVFAGLMDAIADRLADILELIAAELDELSHRLFRSPVTELAARRPPARESADLRVILRRVGHSGDLASKIRDSLHGIGRIVPYVSSLAADWLPPEIKPRLETVRQDVLSLSDYDAHIVNKVQLLLDATLGLINVEQNNIIKVLTIVSVVGIPPTLIASLYGMNFKGMPELDWSWGYPYGLAMIALSAVLPLVWFKWRGWI